MGLQDILSKNRLTSVGTENGEPTRDKLLLEWDDGQENIPSFY